MSPEEPKPPPMHPPQNMTPPAAPVSGSASFVDRLIPSNNGNALLSYYLGLFSIIPCFGLVMGGIAFVTGRRALAAIKETPDLKGGTHAKIGIGCGSLGFLFNAILILIFAVALIGRGATK